MVRLPFAKKPLADTLSESVASSESMADDRLVKVSETYIRGLKQDLEVANAERRRLEDLVHRAEEVMSTYNLESSLIMLERQFGSYIDEVRIRRQSRDTPAEVVFFISNPLSHYNEERRARGRSISEALLNAGVNKNNQPTEREAPEVA
jgi:hypothetical protein